MASVDDLRARIARLLRPLTPLELPLADARGCVLAEGVRAPVPVPSFATVTVEGFAVRAHSYAAGETLRVVDEVPAGFRASEELASGTCIRVWPGAPLPDGADAVVDATLARFEKEGVCLPACAVGHGFVPAGTEIAAGETLAEIGDEMTPRLMGTLSRSSIRSVRVHPRPRVLAVTVGTEFVEPGVPTPLGLVSDHLSFPVVAIAEQAGAIAFRVPPILDDESELVSIVDDSLHRTDIIVLCGMDLAGRARACSSLELSEVISRGEEGCAIGSREGTVVVALGPDLGSILALGELVVPTIIDLQMGRMG
jgi:molybdopterin molybdotransferase